MSVTQNYKTTITLQGAQRAEVRFALELRQAEVKRLIAAGGTNSGEYAEWLADIEAVLEMLGVPA